MSNHNFDLVIIGSGPGGYVAAVRASQLGMKVVVVEQDRLGGVCLNWGCIPTKALLKSAEVYAAIRNANSFGITVDNVSADFSAVIGRSRQIADRMNKGVQFLFKQNNVTHLSGTGRLIDNDKVVVMDRSGEVTDELSAKNIIIATGARPRSIPGVEIDGRKVISSKEAMSLEKAPSSLIVIGAGAIGMEFAYFYHVFGCKVSVLEMMPNILPIEDKEVTDVVLRSFKKLKIDVQTQSLVKKIVTNEAKVVVTIESQGEMKELEAEVALMAIGVQGNHEKLGLEDLNIEVEKSYIKVNSSFQTNVKNIYAIGDIIGPPWLAHVASAEGINAVDRIAGLNVPQLDYTSIPGCTYCQPQVASIGLTEDRARERGYDLKIGRFPFIASGKSLALGERDGLVKLIFDARTDLLLGAHIVHAEATELIGELAVVKSAGLTAHELITTIHAHPTLSEAIMEAAAAAYGEAIHV